MTKKVALTFDEKEIQEVEMVILDDDKDAALELVRKLKKRIDAAQRTICGQGVMAGTQPG